LTDSLEWEQKCDEVENYLTVRPNLIKTDLLSYFGKTGYFNLTVQSSNLSKGYVKVNSLNIKNNEIGINPNPISWTGQYMKNTPFEIKAIPEPGFRFQYWIFNGNIILDTTITINSTIDVSYEAFFESNILSNNPIPLAHNLDSCTYRLTNWSAVSIAGIYPKNMRFAFYTVQEPTLANTTIEGFTNGLFNYTSRTRINGLNQLGISFINTVSTNAANVNPGYPIGKLGGAIIALNTTNTDSVKVSFKARTIAANPKKYAIRLLVREGDQLPFQDFSPVVDYQGALLSGDSAVFLIINLPMQFVHKPYIQLIWRYYNTEIGTGARDQLAIDDIVIQSIRKTNILRNNENSSLGNPIKLISLDRIEGGS
jgi:hypothetical protein